MMISASARRFLTSSARHVAAQSHSRRTSARCIASFVNQPPSKHTNDGIAQPSITMMSSQYLLATTHAQNNRRWLSSAAELPYHIVMGMPALSPTMTTGTISKWNVAVGDSFSAGDSLALIETDKASMDFEAQDDGVVAKLLVPEGGGELEVGRPILVTVEEAGDVAAFENFTPDAAGDAPAAEEAPAAPAAAAAPSAPAAPAADLPYHIVVGMPALSPTMEAGTISQWNVSEGDSFSAGDSLAMIETDKASMDFEAQDDGVVAKILTQSGAGEVGVGVPIMVTVEEKGDVAAFKDFVAGSAPETAATEASAPAVEEVKAAQPLAAAPAPVAAAPAAPAAAPAVAAASVAAAAPAAPAVSLGGSSWGKLAAEHSPLAKALAAKQKQYIGKYGLTGHSTIV